MGFVQLGKPGAQRERPESLTTPYRAGQRRIPRNYVPEQPGRNGQTTEIPAVDLDETLGLMKGVQWTEGTVCIFPNAPNECTLRLSGVTPSGAQLKIDLGRLNPVEGLPRLTVTSVRTLITTLGWQKGLPEKGENDWNGYWVYPIYPPQEFAVFETEAPPAL